MRGLLIPITGPLEEVELDGGLDQLQALVGGGNIEAIPLPAAILGEAAYKSTAYVDEEGKFKDWTDDPDASKAEHAGFNGRATDFMVPGVGIFPGDYVAGPMLLCGFDPDTGKHAKLLDHVIRRARKIAREAGA